MSVCRKVDSLIGDPGQSSLYFSKFVCPIVVKSSDFLSQLAWPQILALAVTKQFSEPFTTRFHHLWNGTNDFSYPGKVAGRIRGLKAHKAVRTEPLGKLMKWIRYRFPFLLLLLRLLGHVYKGNTIDSTLLFFLPLKTYLGQIIMPHPPRLYLFQAYEGFGKVNTIFN